MQTSEFSHVWDLFSGSAVSWDIFRGGMAPHGNLGDIFMAGCFLSGWVGGACVGFLSSRLIRSTCQVGHFSFVRYFECLEKFYFWKLFCHKAAGSYNNDSNNDLTITIPIFVIVQFKGAVTEIKRGGWLGVLMHSFFASLFSAQDLAIQYPSIIHQEFMNKNLSNCYKS